MERPVRDAPRDRPRVSAQPSRRAGFAPVTRRESFHTGWELQILADVDVVALAPGSVALELPEGIVAVPVSDPPDRLVTAIVSRKADPSPVSRAFREAAVAAFSSARQAPTAAVPSPRLRT